MSGMGWGGRGSLTCNIVWTESEWDGMGREG